MRVETPFDSWTVTNADSAPADFPRLTRTGATEITWAADSSGTPFTPAQALAANHMQLIF